MDIAKFDVAKLISGELTVFFVFLVGMFSFSTTKLEASISSANVMPRESGFGSENPRSNICIDIT